MVVVKKEETFKVLVFGDVFGRVGRQQISFKLSELRRLYSPDLIIANGENVTHGSSISYKHYLFLTNLGVDVITSGNHIFSLPETVTYISEVDNLIRPANWGRFAPGNGSVVIFKKGKKVRVTNLIGRVFMSRAYEDVFACLEKLVSLSVNKQEDLHLVDFHAEATAEKKALALFFDGKISALFGTHTHVQTNDEVILPKGTAFITDIGMVGAINSVIGADPAGVLLRSRNNLPARIIPALGPGMLNAILLEFDRKTNRALVIKKIRWED